MRSAVVAFAAVLLAGSLFGQATARAADGAEYQLKAAFLYRFAQFTEWPAAALAKSEQLMLCVLGEDPFGSQLAGIVGNTVHQRRLAVQRLSDLQQLGQCHLAFLGAMRPDLLGQAIRRGRQLGVLTIGETQGFAAGGGMIQLVVVDDRIQFEINSAAADRAGLKLSSHLLKLARTLYTSYPD